MMIVASSHSFFCFSPSASPSVFRTSDVQYSPASSAAGPRISHWIDSVSPIIIHDHHKHSDSVSDCLFQGCSQSLRFSRSSCVALKQGSSNRVTEVRCKGKGFGELLQKNRKNKPVEKEKLDWCPCGNGIVLKEYIYCCGPYHQGSIEPNPLTLLKARYSAYALGIVPYIVRTTYEGSQNFEGKKRLEEDVRLTCEQIRFTKLEITETEIASENEAFISFKASYLGVGKSVSKGQGRVLLEKSRFIKQGDRWLFSDSIPLSQASEAAWRYL